MLDRETALGIVRRAYAARASGNKVELARFWSEGAHFEIVGDNSLLPEVMRVRPPLDTLDRLIDQFVFSDLTELDSVVEGNRVVVRWLVTITARGLEPRTTQLLDLIDLNNDGKIVRLLQFADTALIRHLAGS